MKKLLIIATLIVGGAAGYVISTLDIPSIAANKGKITAEEAKTIALKTFNGTVTEMDYDDEFLTPHYEFEIVSDTEEVDVEVNARSGKAVIKERKQIFKSNTTTKDQVETQTAPTKAMISQEEAIKIALTKASGKVTKVELDNNVYEIEIKDGKVEYDIDVNAITGDIVKFEQENTTLFD